MVGQKKLLDKIQDYTLDTFPHSVLFIGEKGCGKHLLCSEISKLLNLDTVDITENISAEYIENIYRSPLPKIYLIDLSKFLFDKEQNALLKFVEEPLSNSFVILLTESKKNVLDTIYNRCRVFEFEPYSKQDLRQFIQDKENEELILNIARTPGQLLSSNFKDIKELYDLCDKIATKLSSACFANTLTIADKINYKDQYDKFDIDIFLDTLVFTLFNNYLKSNNKIIYNMYLLTIEQRKKLYDKRVNKAIFMQSFLTKAWKLSRGMN